MEASVISKVVCVLVWSAVALGQDGPAAEGEPVAVARFHRIQQNELAALIDTLRQHFPRSMPLWVQARNMLSGKCTWPATELLVDCWPDFRVVMSRPLSVADDRYNQSADYGLRQKSYQAVSLFVRDGPSLERFLQDNFMHLIDWYRPVQFNAVPTELVPVMIEQTTRIGNIRIDDGQHDNQSDYVLLLRAKDLQTSKPPTLPAGYRLGALEATHIPQILTQWKFIGRLGHAVHATDYFQYLLNHSFPNVGLFDAAGQLVAGNVYEPDGNLGQGYLQEGTARDGPLLEIINRKLAEKVLSELGQEVTWAYVKPEDEARLGVYERLGAHKQAGFTTQSLDYIPYLY